MKNKINKFFKIFSGRPKDIGFTESISILPFISGWIIAILLMFYAFKTNNLLFGLFSLVFAWQTGWGMSIERSCKSEENKNK
ncbi:hypothetical protein EXM90_12200 [Clostridium botulinum]|uniref:hypothetical protein n=1 Tax=Clostridium botulinum TaxID=1491 RepID=UPI000773A1D2|nr:hypothetical protein [Clostridium botulinum]MBN3352130.1 hypothetical protein [Clostridium botulinum]MBN3367093.1 hypothetical protein [Clostridium botulinum]MBN3371729.1 hypothetical protein [Clostridium botulinum]MBN3375465.1 hypothetical protein [Clostridium botulinum]MBN3384374.1 hypothetical protein [Clostridium botulinum]